MFFAAKLSDIFTEPLRILLFFHISSPMWPSLMPGLPEEDTDKPITKYKASRITYSQRIGSLIRKGFDFLLRKYTISDPLFTPTGFLPRSLPPLQDIGGDLPEKLPVESRGLVYRAEDTNLTGLPAQFIILPEYVMITAGLRDPTPREDDVFLYARPRFRQQVNFIRDDVIRCGKIGRIYGQPGTGKSSATLYVAIQLVIEYGWDVLWTHVTSGSLECVHMKPDCSMGTACIRVHEFGRFLDRFRRFEGSGGQLVIIDGVTADDEIRLQSTGVHWVLCGRPHGLRRLVVVSSQGKFKRLNGQARQRSPERIFIQWSWTEHDYETAMKNPQFAASVGAVMDATGPAKNVSIDDSKWKTKYYYAGGSARFMFAMTTAQVIDAVEDAVEEQVMAMGKCKTNEQFDMLSGDELFSIFENQRYEIVSEYAKGLVLRALGSKEILEEHPLASYLK